MILTGAIMIKTTAMLMDELKDFTNRKTKIARMVKRGEIYPIVKGFYETDPSVSPHLLAATIYQPSYVSFQYALSYHGLIPETAYTVTSATYKKRKTKLYQTNFGAFFYRDVPAKAFPYAIELRKEGEYYFRIASPEKAICDQIYTMAVLSSEREIPSLLYEDLRIEPDDFENLNLSMFESLCPLYRSRNLQKLASWIQKGCQQ